MSWQAGDKRLTVGRREVTLRLTVGALSELCERLNVTTAEALASVLKAATPPQWTNLTQALLRPVHGDGAQALALAIPAARVAPLVAELFEEAF